MERMMSRGRVEQFKKYLDTGTNRKQIEELIGSDGIAHYKEFLNMFSNAKNNRAMQRVAKTTAAFLTTHRWWSDVAGASLGSTAAAALGLPAHLGGTAGFAGVEGTRWILRKAATDPAVGKMLMYAAEHDLDPRIYVPLVARAIHEPFEQQKQPEGEKEPAEANQ
jgi:hypothetical protein